MQQNIIFSSCKATPTKNTHNSFSHLTLISLISLIFLSVLIEATPLDIIAVPNLQSFANYAAAAYCRKPIDKWDCGEVCQAVPDTEVVKVFTYTNHNTKGFIAKDESKKLIVVSYRGTEPGSYRNYITDLLAFKSDYLPNRRLKVHTGFYDAFRAVQSQVTNDVVKLHQENPDFSIGFMGHSLGGALAAFSALDLIQQVPELGNKNEQLFLATFGQPRVGDAAFAKYVDDNVKTIRTIVRGDPIPRLPPSLPIPFVGNYLHFGEELYIPNPDENPDIFTECSAEDPNCSQSVPLTQLKFKYHSAPYYGVSMKDCTKDDGNTEVDDDEDYDFSTDPYFSYNQSYNYEADFQRIQANSAIYSDEGANGTNYGVDSTKGVNGTNYGVDGAKGVNGTNYDGAKGVNGTNYGVDGAKGVNGTNYDGAKGINGTNY